jgi:hypothetical protein
MKWLSDCCCARDAHRHYRRGSECANHVTCDAYRPRWAAPIRWLAKIVGRVAAVVACF